MQTAFWHEFVKKERQQRGSAIEVSLVQHVPVEGTWNHREVMSLNPLWESTVVKYRPRRVTIPTEHQLAENHESDSSDFAEPVLRRRLRFLGDAGRDDNGQSDGEVEAEAEVGVSDEYDEEDDGDSDHSGNVDDVPEQLLETSGLNIFDRILAEEGMYQESYVIYMRETPPVPVGRIEFIHGQSLSIKGCCEHFSHSASSSSTSKHTGACYCLMHATMGMKEKYRAVAKWLRDGRGVSRDAHLAAAKLARREFGYLR